MISVSEVVSSMEFSDKFNIIRKEGEFIKEGIYTVSQIKKLERFGSIQPASQNDLVSFLQEGERQDNFIKCYCNQDILLSDGDMIESDHIEQDGIYYRVIFAKNYSRFGYWFAIAQGTSNPYDDLEQA
jgi:hypothetical protein